MRIRPLLSHEVAAGATAVAQPVDDKVVVLTEPRDETDILRRNRQRERHYALDAAFGESSTAAEVYARTAKPLLKSVLNGYNATVFAYGPVRSFFAFGYSSIAQLTLPPLLPLSLRPALVKRIPCWARRASPA